jgi:histidine ammonia-lyase
MYTVQLDGETLTIEDVVKVAHNEAKVVIPEKVKARVKACREFLKNFWKKAK